MGNHHPRILLVNPWIYDFAAYDFWVKPLGLLILGSIVREAGGEIHLLDCLDRNHPGVVAMVGRKKPKPTGTGKFYRERVAKPAVVSDIPRNFCRYGMPSSVFQAELENIPPPDIIMVTSVMTYWYPGVQAAVAELRRRFPQTPIILGGIYATLLPDHATQTIKPDLLVKGPGENVVIDIVNELCKSDLEVPHLSDIDTLPLPAYDLYAELASIAMLTSRGCPFNCSFCASKLLSEHFQQRNPHAVVDEIERWHRSFNVTQIAFYDDALLINKDVHIKIILQEVLRRGIAVQFHTPNGVHAREIDFELATLMHRSGFSTLRLSYETSERQRQSAMKSKVCDDDLIRAIAFLERAGFRRRDLGVYVLMGLPEQEILEVIESMAFVLSLGTKIRLASFSPIPGTVEWQRAVDRCGFPADADPLCTNNSVFPLKDEQAPFALFAQLGVMAREYNAGLDEGAIYGNHRRLADRMMRNIKRMQK